VKLSERLIFTQMYRLTIRATDETVPPVLIKFMEEKLGHGEEVEKPFSGYEKGGNNEYEVGGLGD
jgi:hypothetical protein